MFQKLGRGMTKGDSIIYVSENLFCPYTNQMQRQELGISLDKKCVLIYGLPLRWMKEPIFITYLL